MESINAIFKELGGSGKVAALLGVKPSAASEMKRRQSIPVVYWPTLVDACKDRGIRGVNFDVLVSLHAKKREKAA